MHQRRNFGTRLFKKTKEDRHLHQKSNPGNHNDGQRIYQTLRYHCSKRFGKRNIIIFGKYSATGNLSYPRKNKIGCIRNKDSIYTITRLGISTKRGKCLLPPPATKHKLSPMSSDQELCRRAGKRRSKSLHQTYTGR